MFLRMGIMSQNNQILMKYIILQGFIKNCNELQLIETKKGQL